MIAKRAKLIPLVLLANVAIDICKFIPYNIAEKLVKASTLRETKQLSIPGYPFCLGPSESIFLIKPHGEQHMPLSITQPQRLGLLTLSVQSLGLYPR